MLIEGRLASSARMIIASAKKIRNSTSFMTFYWRSQKLNCDDRCILDLAFGTYHELTKPSRHLGGETEFRS
jgi:hypothetical protein